MQYVKFLLYEFIIFSSFIIVNYYYDGLLNSPLTKAGLVASLIAVPLLGLLFALVYSLFKQFNTISRYHKILLTIPNFILAGVVTGIIMSLFTS